MQVQPILRKRQWTVPIVREFFPDRKELLGLNVNGRRGTTDEIRIRLRPAHAPSAFLDFHAVLGTLLHELVHNVRGPHDAEFYKILDELWTDAEDLMDRGVSGTGAGECFPSYRYSYVHMRMLHAENNAASHCTLHVRLYLCTLTCRDICDSDWMIVYNVDE